MLLYFISGTVDPSSVAVSANTGTQYIYINTSTGVQTLFVKNDDGLTTNWTSLGPVTSDYTPSDPTKWASPAPTKIQAALDRIAAVVGNVTPIP